MNALKKNTLAPEIGLFNYQAGIAFYEEFRPALMQQSTVSRIYTTGISIVLDFGLLYFLNKFKRKGALSNHNFSTVPNPEPALSPRLPDTGTYELIDLLVGMIRSTGEFHGTAKRKDNS